MVSRSGESSGARPIPPRTAVSPNKPRVSRIGTSPTKRDDRMGKTSAKDVAELKDYVCRE